MQTPTEFWQFACRFVCSDWTFLQSHFICETVHNMAAEMFQFVLSSRQGYGKPTKQCNNISIGKTFVRFESASMSVFIFQLQSHGIQSFNKDQIVESICDFLCTASKFHFHNLPSTYKDVPRYVVIIRYPQKKREWQLGVWFRWVFLFL